MIFRLDPPSGYPNSYIDVKFYVDFDQPTSGELSLINITTHENLFILSSSSGYIRDETVLVFSKAKKVEGYINLFNLDKMNNKMSSYVEVEIECSVVDSTQIQRSIASFFNESKSLDAGIVPFDLTIVNKEIDINSGVDIELSLFSGVEKKYELAIRPTDGSKVCTIESVCRKGPNKIVIPWAVVYSDLGVSAVRRKKYQIFYVMFKGLDFNGYVNRQYIPIDGAEISFKGSRFMPAPQARIGPDGSPLSKEFVLSDRYLVPTWKDFSSFGRRMENVPILCNMSRFLHEVQNLRLAGIPIAGSAVKEKSVRHPDYDIKDNRLFRYVNADVGTRNFYEDVAVKVFSSMPNKNTVKAVSKSSSVQVKKGGCGCSRHK